MQLQIPKIKKDSHPGIRFISNCISATRFIALLRTKVQNLLHILCILRSYHKKSQVLFFVSPLMKFRENLSYSVIPYFLPHGANKMTNTLVDKNRRWWSLGTLELA